MNWEAQLKSHTKNRGQNLLESPTRNCQKRSQITTIGGNDISKTGNNYHQNKINTVITLTKIKRKSIQSPLLLVRCRQIYRVCYIHY